ncbi:MAG: VanW family protein [Clostridia bacterium]|nr:VanW family protein [Clostridia bacterium]MDY5264107.1 VanW family protein [Eubacteriales bacterium]MDY5440075.1 VanW family protein [Eubacteriales bacterium]
MKKRSVLALILLSVTIVALSFCGFSYSTKLRIKIVGEQGVLEGEYSPSKFYIAIKKQDLISDRSKGCLKNLKKIDGKLYNDVVNFCKNEYKTPKNASVKYDYESEYPFVFKEEIYGKKVDEQKLYTDVLRVLYGKIEEIKVCYCDIIPEIKISDLKDEYFLNATFTTDYSFSSSNRKLNVELAVKKLDNKVILPRESFSFNETIGKRSKENGFLDAPIIVDGKYVSGVGGGICQVSTTLYNAFLLAGLTVTEARRHTLPVGYVEPSFDAMVSEWSDLKAENLTDKPAYIKATAKNGKIEIKIYGKKQEYSVVRSSVVTDILPYKTIIVKDGEGKKGKNGLKSYSKLIYYKDGKIVGEKIVRKDEYLPQDEIVVESEDKEIYP